MTLCRQASGGKKWGAPCTLHPSWPPAPSVPDCHTPIHCEEQGMTSSARERILFCLPFSRGQWCWKQFTRGFGENWWREGWRLTGWPAAVPSIVPSPE
ncbi:hypothetical protein BaRGS_00003774 [Batillaria attramentaria]|uniref:Uncharacterized protein n=1 Tax=Batillaria attramentaria TaxID=370345 RepID=A0ABD0LZ56_9CAEN